MAKKKKIKQTYNFPKYDLNIAIDLSVTSPGLCVELNDYYHFYFWNQRKRELDFLETGNNWEIQAEDYPIDHHTREERFDKLTSDIMRILNDYIHDSNYNIAIEGYSYGSTNSQSQSSLYENGGVMRNKLYNSNYQFQEIPPTVIKKHFAGKGNANKPTMYEQYKTLKRFPELYDLLNIKEPANGDIPKPIEDLVDSLAIIYFIKDIQLPPINVVGNLLKKINKARR